MKMSEKCHSNNSDSPLTSRHTDSGKKGNFCQFISRMMPFVIDPSAEEEYSENSAVIGEDYFCCMPL